MSNIWNVVGSYFTLGVGSKNMMYTLRLVELHTSSNGQYSTDTYYCNLSTDYDRAIEKAKSYAVLEGIQFQPISVQALDEITRSSSEEIASRNAEYSRAKEIESARRDQERQQNREYAEAQTTFWFGKHESHTPEEVFERDPEYVRWLLELELDEDLIHSTKQFYMLKVQKYWESRKSELKSSEYFGSVGDKIEIEVLCTKVTGFVSDFGYRGTWVNLYICQDNDGNVFKIQYTGSVWDMDEMSKYTIRGTIKSHDEYEGIKQTSLTRVKVIS